MDDLIKEFGSFKEVKLKSYEDIEIPGGLFPEAESSVIRGLSTRAMNMLGGKNMDDINAYFYGLYDFFNTIKNGLENPPPEMEGQIEQYKNNSEKYAADLKKIPKTPSSPPVKKMADDMTLLSLSDPIYFSQDENWINEKSAYDNVSDSVERAVYHYAYVALYKFIHVLDEAKNIQSNQDEIDDSYYRLGKSVGGFYYVNSFLDLAYTMSKELNVLKKKEEASKEIRQKTAQKGGKKRTAKFDDLEEKVIALYLEKYSSRTPPAAGKLIAKDLAADIQGVLTSDEPHLTLARYIRKYNAGLIESV